MKLTTVAIAAAALAGAAGMTTNAAAHATVYSEYIGSESTPGEGVYFSVTNDGNIAFTDIVVGGTDYGSLAPGASTPFTFISDSSAINAPITITAGGNTTTTPFTSLYGDIDADTSPIAIGSVPEPATWALLLAGFGGLGAAMRMKRKAPISV